MGYANVGGVERASLWTGSAASWVDLHDSLPAEFIGSAAYAIWDDGTSTYVGGWGYTDSEPGEALFWTVPEPASGLVLAAGMTALALFRRRSRIDGR